MRSSPNAPLAALLLVALAALAGGCGGGVSSAPLDPLAGSTYANGTRELPRQAQMVDNSDDDSTAHPAKAPARGPREKRYKGGE